MEAAHNKRPRMFILNLLGLVLLVHLNKGDFHSHQKETAHMCYACKRFHLGLCYDTMSFCILKYQQSCATENVYFLRKKGMSMYFYSRLSCIYNCEDINVYSFEKRVELICCNNHDYCNLPEGS